MSGEAFLYPTHNRIIYHIDVNSAFLSWEACRRLAAGDTLDLRTIPSAVGGDQSKRHGIVLAKSHPAKAFGIKTGEPLLSARRKCPGLVVVPPSYPLYAQNSRAFIALLGKYAPVVEQYSIDEAFCDMTGTEQLYGPPVSFASKLKEEIKTQLGFTVNVGVSSNKLLAKMASDFEKPDCVHTLFPEEIPAKMWPLPVGDLFFVGRSTSRKLKALGIRTIGDLAKTDPDILISHLKKQGQKIWEHANGIDYSPVEGRNSANKSYGNSITVSFDVTDKNTARQILLSLCETVGARLRADGARTGLLAVSVKDYEFHCSSHQQTLLSVTDATLDLYQGACSLLDELWNGTPIRQFGFTAGHITYDMDYQYSLFENHDYERLSRLDAAVDRIRSRYGEDAIQRACFLNSGHSHLAGGHDPSCRTGVTKSSF